MFASGSRPSTLARPVASASTSCASPEVAYAPRNLGNFPHRLSFYEKPPTEEITLEEFEEWAICRLRLLADIEAGYARNKSHDEIKKVVENRAKEHLPLGSNVSPDAVKERKKDLYSHFILRLAFCRSEELRQRFLKAETTLFRIRYESDLESERNAFVKSLNFGWHLIDPSEKAKLRTQLADASSMKEERVDVEPFFKVKWTKVTDLIAKRAVYVHKGYAYVPSSQEMSLVLAEFSSRLQRALEMTAKALPRLDDDERLIPILNHLSIGFASNITSEYTGGTTADGELITAEMIPQLAQESFPLCMRSMQSILKSDRHLKYEGRQQYGLFLKGIGLSVEESLVFWRRSFNVVDDKFNKEYRYNIRHNYGLEGSRKNYAPRNCISIITGVAPGSGQAHGCPFKHFSEQNLQSTLSQMYGLSIGEQKEIVKAAKSGHYHVACTRLFEIQHKIPNGEGLGKGQSVDHPNRYFDESRRLLRGDDKVKTEPKEATSAAVTAASAAAAAAAPPDATAKVEDVKMDVDA